MRTGDDDTASAVVNIPETLLGLAQMAPGAIALTGFTTADANGPVRSWTRNELARDVIRVASTLSCWGHGASDRIALLLPSVPEYPIVLWGAASVCSVLPINPLLRPDNIEHLLRISGISCLVSPSERLDVDMSHVGRELQERIPGLRLREVGPGFVFTGTADGRPLDEIPQGRSASEPAMLFHTGGTTGRPKVAVLTLANIMAAVSMLATTLEYGPTDILVSALPMFHIAGAVVAGLAPLLQGAHLVLPSPPGLRDQSVVNGFWYLLEKVEATIMAAVPTSLAALSQVPLDADLGNLDFVLTGASSLAPETARRFSDVTGKAIHTGYGMTETAGVIAYVPRRLAAQPASVGPALPGLKIKIQPLDASRKDGRPGRVLVRGPNVFQGYLGGTSSPRDSDGWLDTGDLGIMDDDGWLTLTGRSKDLIIRSGHNIDPAVIEEAASAHASVSLAAAVGGIDSYAGEVPVLFVQLVPSARPEDVLPELRGLLARTIAEPPARPREIHALDRMPLTAVGKIFKPALRLDAARKRLVRALEAQGVAIDDVELDLSLKPSGRLAVGIQANRASKEMLAGICREILLFDVALNCNGVDVRS